MCARVYRVKCFNFSNIRIRIRIRTDFYIKIRIQRMRILINSVTSLEDAKQSRVDMCKMSLKQFAERHKIIVVMEPGKLKTWPGTNL